MNKFYITPANKIAFGNNQGELIINDGKLRFEGDAEESAKVLFEAVVRTFNEHINQAILREREACAKVCDEQEERYLQMYRGVGDFAKSTVKGSQWADGLCDAASECAEIIRARSKHD